MTKLKEKQNIPEGWKEERLGDMLECIVDNRGKTPPIQTKGIPLIEVNSVGDRKINYSVVTKYVSEEVYNEWFRKHIENGDILFSTVGRTASCSIYNETIKSAIAQNLVGLRFKSRQSEFMYYLLSQDSNNRKFKNIEMLGAQPSVKVTQMVDLSFLVPDDSEKAKIAKVIGTWDGAIEKLEQTIALKLEVKKGLMQKLLTGELRLSGFSDEWKNVPLHEIAVFNPKSAKLPGNFVYIDLESVKKGQLVKKEQITLSSAPSRAQRLLSKNDILFQTVRPYQKNNLLFSEEGDFVASTGYAQIKARDSAEFLYQLLYTDFFVAKVLERCTGSNYPAINSSDLAKIYVKVPASGDEQREIGKILASADREIINLGKKKKILQDQKKYLLNNLVTGQIRTPENL